MSATGTGIVPSGAFESNLVELNEWKRATAQCLAEFRRWATVGRSLDEQTAARLAHLERRLLSERLTIAFVAEYSRGKSELINALFFADLGTRLLPSTVGRTTLCPTEILWNPLRPPSLRLLPIETRASPRALREHIAEIDTWTEIPLDPARPTTLAPTCEALSETRTVSAAQAANLGLGGGDGDTVEIPRWRYAIVNLPHPVLKSGLVILDTPGRNTMGTEPEITVQRMPDASAIVFMLGADTGVAPADRELWSDHIEPIQGVDHICYVVVNKIDVLRDGLKPDSQILDEIDRQVKATADGFGVAPERIFALSARQGLTAKIHADRDALIESRLDRLEQALARGMIGQKRIDHAAAVRAESRIAFAESRTLIESRLGFAREQLEEIAAVQGKNQKLVAALSRKSTSERLRLEQARAVMMALRTVHHRQLADLVRLLDSGVVREAGQRARLGVINSAFSGGIGAALDQFFRQSRAHLHDAIAVLGEARAMMDMASAKFAREYEIAIVEVGDFATERFVMEIDRLEERCARDFKGAGSLLTRRRSTLGGLFFDSVAQQVVHVFEIAEREARTWMDGFMRPLEAQLQAFQDQANTRVEGMGRIQAAETDLLARLEELKALAADVAAQLREGDGHHRALMELLEVGKV